MNHSSLLCPKRPRIVLRYGHRDRGECDHDHEQVEQQRHARGKPDIDIARLSKEDIARAMESGWRRRHGAR